MKNTTFIFGIVLILIVGVFVFIYNNGNEKLTNENNSGEIQKITLSMKNLNYYPNTVKVNVNQPVRIYLDNSVQGCFRSFTIRDFRVSKYLKTANDYVEFTPTKKGSYRFACSMGMGTGTLIVE